MPLQNVLLLFAGGFLAGIINVVAGGAGFMTFPLLLATGMSEVEANASNFIALLPANLVGTFIYRHELKAVRQHMVLRLVLAACGGMIGSLILIYTGKASFQAAIPWLLLFATTSFAIGPKIRALTERHTAFDRSRYVWLSLLLEFCVYIYSGYFGLGMGIILFAIYGVFWTMTIHEGNAIRNITTSVSSLVAIILFIVSGIIRWLPSLIMMSGAITGGYVAVRVAKKLPAHLVRNTILCWAVVLTAVAFYRYF